MQNSGRARKKEGEGGDMMASGFKVDTLLKNIMKTRKKLTAGESAGEERHLSRFIPSPLPPA